MKKIFMEAHKMTREMVKEYKVDYQAQFSINLSYLLNKEEEEEMLNEEIRKELEKMEVEVEKIQRADEVISGYDKVTKLIVEEMYSDRDIRRRMKNQNAWNDKDMTLELGERYKGKGNIEVTRQKLWANYGKVRVYFDITIDEEYTLKRYVNIA